MRRVGTFVLSMLVISAGPALFATAADADTNTTSCQSAKPLRKAPKKKKVTSFPAAVPAAGRVTPSTFTPTFTITFPATGWRKIEAPGVSVDFGFNGGSQDDIGSTDLLFVNLAPSTPAQALSQMTSSTSYSESAPTAACVGNVTAQTFDVTPTTGPGGPLFKDQLYLPGTKARIWIANVRNTAIVVQAEAADAAFDTFVAQVESILQTVKFH